jgi:hypothetical protein
MICFKRLISRAESCMDFDTCLNKIALLHENGALVVQNKEVSRFSTTYLF